MTTTITESIILDTLDTINLVVDSEVVINNSLCITGYLNINNGSLSVNGNMTIHGCVYIKGTLNVTGTMTILGPLNLQDGKMTINSELLIVNSANINGYLYAQADTVFNNTLTASSNSRIRVDGSIKVNDYVTINGWLYTSKDMIIKGGVYKGHIVIGGDLVSKETVKLILCTMFSIEGDILVSGSLETDFIGNTGRIVVRENMEVDICNIKKTGEIYVGKDLCVKDSLSLKQGAILRVGESCKTYKLVVNKDADFTVGHELHVLDSLSLATSISVMKDIVCSSMTYYGNLSLYNKLSIVNDLTVNGNLVVMNSVSVHGNVLVKGDILIVESPSNECNKLKVLGKTEVKNLYVEDSSEFATNELIAKKDVILNGDAKMESLLVKGSMYMNNYESHPINIIPNACIDGNLSIMSSLVINSVLRVKGDLTLAIRDTNDDEYIRVNKRAKLVVNGKMSINNRLETIDASIRGFFTVKGNILSLSGDANIRGQVFFNTDIICKTLRVYGSVMSANEIVTLNYMNVTGDVFCKQLIIKTKNKYNARDSNILGDLTVTNDIRLTKTVLKVRGKTNINGATKIDESSKLITFTMQKNMTNN